MQRRALGEARCELLRTFNRRRCIVGRFRLALDAQIHSKSILEKRSFRTRQNGRTDNVPNTMAAIKANAL